MTQTVAGDLRHQLAAAAMRTMEQHLTAIRQRYAAGLLAYETSAGRETTGVVTVLDAGVRGLIRTTDVLLLGE